MTVAVASDGPVTIITIERPKVRNAVDGPTARALSDAFRAFDADDSQPVAVLTGAGGSFCSGADLNEIGTDPDRVRGDGDGPMGPTRILLSKPVIAAIEGHAVAGGLELAVWCDLRVAASDAVLGMFSRRFGVPLIDLGTVRLPRLIGHSRALDLILTGRGVTADEAFGMGLVNRVVGPGEALAAAVELGRQLAAFPQAALRNDRLAAYEQWSLDWEDAWGNELRRGLDTLSSGETRDGAARFTAGHGRHGTFD